MTPDIEISSDELEIVKGLQEHPKHISSKFLYDAKGEELFRQIMEVDEYYLTNCELDILKSQASTIIDAMETKTFDIVELGAGDGSKTRHIIRHAIDAGCTVRFVPIDIAQSALDAITLKMAAEFPDVEVAPICGDYLHGLRDLHEGTHNPELTLFLGSNIGNYSDLKAVGLLKDLRESLTSDDRLVVGFDLRKNPQIIHRAYNDSQGLTRAFNLNVLHRLRSEFNVALNSDDFDHYEYYDPERGEAHSYLVSLVDQEMRFNNTDTVVQFAANELIHTEVSRKYDINEIDQLGRSAGWTIVDALYDRQSWFADVIFRASKVTSSL